MSLDFRAQLEHQSQLFRTAIEASEPSARVPTCPDWSADDLLAHLTEVQWFWSTVLATPVRHASQLAEIERPERADGRDALLSAFDDAHAKLCDALASTDAGAARWMWTRDPGLHTAGYIARRQAHEALIHRVDAELTAAQPISQIDPVLAADGVDEILRVMLGGHPEWTTFAAQDGIVRFEAVDTGDDWTVHLGRLTGTHPESGETVDETSLLPIDSGEPIATISGRAWELDLWLWNRGDFDMLERSGDTVALQHVVDALAEGLN